MVYIIQKCTANKEGGRTDKTIFTDKWLSQLLKVGPFSYDHLNFLKYRKDKIKTKNGDRYRVEVIQKNNHRAWSSPIWIKN